MRFDKEKVRYSLYMYKDKCLGHNLTLDEVKRITQNEDKAILYWVSVYDPYDKPDYDGQPYIIATLSVAILWFEDKENQNHKKDLNMHECIVGYISGEMIKGKSWVETMEKFKEKLWIYEHHKEAILHPGQIIKFLYCPRCGRKIEEKIE